jgi:predicted nucleotidyltransferase
MLTRDDIIKKLRVQRSYLAAEYGVSKIGIFGSYAKGYAAANSDVDLVVEFETPIGFRFIELAEYLERLLGLGVDLLTPAGIQNIRLERVAQSISESVVYV